MAEWQFDWTFQNKRYLYFSVWMTEWSFEWLVYSRIAIQSFRLKLKRKRKLRDTKCTFPQTLLDGSSSASSACNYTVHGLMRSDPSILSNTNRLITPLCIAGCWMWLDYIIKEIVILGPMSKKMNKRPSHVCCLPLFEDEFLTWVRVSDQCQSTYNHWSEFPAKINKTSGCK